MSKGQYRKRPLSIYRLFHRHPEGMRYYHDLVLDRYRYKGVEVFAAVKRNLHRTHDYRDWMAGQDASKPVIVQSANYGEKALLYALLHPEAQVIAVEEDAEKCDLMRYCMEGIVDNVVIKQKI